MYQYCNISLGAQESFHIGKCWHMIKYIYNLVTFCFILHSLVNYNVTHAGKMSRNDTGWLQNVDFSRIWGFHKNGFIKPSSSNPNQV